MASVVNSILNGLYCLSDLFISRSNVNFYREIRRLSMENAKYSRVVPFSVFIPLGLAIMKSASKPLV